MDRPATYHQRKALFYLTKNSEVLDVNMSMANAGKRIRELNNRRRRSHGNSNSNNQVPEI